MGLKQKAVETGIHAEKLSGRTQQRFFSIEESGKKFVYPGSYEVGLNKRGEIDAANLSATEVNREIRRLLSEGVGTITLRNPGAKHGVAVGILNRLNLKIEGSLGYFGCGLI